MSKLSLSDLKSISETAGAVILAIAGKHEEISPNDSYKMCGLWDDLNDKHAPPKVVKSMADELINLRALNEALKRDNYYRLVSTDNPEWEARELIAEYDRRKVEEIKVGLRAALGVYDGCVVKEGEDG